MNSRRALKACAQSPQILYKIDLFDFSEAANGGRFAEYKCYFSFPLVGVSLLDLVPYFPLK